MRYAVTCWVRPHGSTEPHYRKTFHVAANDCEGARVAWHDSFGDKFQLHHFSSVSLIGGEG